jgi:predicted peptidase
MLRIIFKDTHLGGKIMQKSVSFKKDIVVHINLNYLLHLPQRYNKEEDKKWPLVLFLHGAGEIGDNLEILRVQALPKIIESREEFPSIVVSPQCPTGSSWHNEFNSLDELLDNILENYEVDSNRIYLTGLSMGGFASWDYAVIHPDLFAAVIPICGGTSYPDHLYLIKDVPVWAFHGAKDDIVPIEESQIAVDSLKNFGGDIRFTVYPNAGHDAWTETYNNSEVFEWLLKQCKHGNVE